MTFASALHLPRGFHFGGALAHHLAEMREAQARRRAYAALLAEFDRMSDAEWLDLGVSRHNARELARATVYAG